MFPAVGKALVRQIHHRLMALLQRPLQHSRHRLTDHALLNQRLRLHINHTQIQSQERLIASGTLAYALIHLLVSAGDFPRRPQVA